jgi:hypothetical protein
MPRAQHAITAACAALPHVVPSLTHSCLLHSSCNGPPHHHHPPWHACTVCGVVWIQRRRRMCRWRSLAPAPAPAPAPPRPPASAHPQRGSAGAAGRVVHHEGIQKLWGQRLCARELQVPFGCVRTSTPPRMRGVCVGGAQHCSQWPCMHACTHSLPASTGRLSAPQICRVCCAALARRACGSCAAACVPSCCAAITCQGS